MVVSKITEHAIRQVTAYLNISERKEMRETNKGQWGSVSWPYTFSTLWNYTAKCYEVNCPTFELLIRLKEPSVDGQKMILKQLGQLFESQTFSDVQFNVKGQKMTAHAAILAAGSPVMAAMFQREGFQEGETQVPNVLQFHRLTMNHVQGQNRKVDVVDMEPVVFKQLLLFLYTGTAPEHRHDTITEPLFLAADKYQIESLKMICEESLMASLTLDNVARFLVLAHLHSTPKLMECCMTFLAANKKIIWARNDWKQLNKNYPDLFYLATERMNVE